MTKPHGPLCRVLDCDRFARNPLVQTGGYCRRHSLNWKHFGDPLARPGVLRELTVKGLVAFYKTSQETDCWVWIGRTHKSGYGLVCCRTTSKNEHYAHRLSWELHHGPIPTGLQVCHHCDNPPCVNPEHLFLGTAWDNTWDSKRKGRAIQGERVASSRLCAEQVLEIRKLGRETTTLSQRQIGALFGVTRSAVQRVLSRGTWKHLP